MAKSRPESTEYDAPLGPDPRKAGAHFLPIGVATALLWLAAAAATLTSVVGLDALAAAGQVQAAALVLMVLTPAFLIVFAALAAQEGARGRAEAARLAEAADRLHNPAPAAEAAARRLGVSVRGEIAALDRALEHVSAKLREVEAVIARQTMAVDNAAAAAEAGARHMVNGLERERNDLLQISDDLHNQARLIGEAISRHTKMIGDAARVAEAEVRSADEALESRLSSFGAAAALISDRTQALNAAAQESAEAALRLEGALSTSLDALAKATSLTDAARQSAEAATLAANSTAGAIRETTQRAVEEARRAAEVIRAEAAAFTNLAPIAGGGGGGSPGSVPAPARPAPEPQRRQGTGFLGGGAPRPAAPNAPRPGDPGFADSLGAPAPGARPAAEGPSGGSGQGGGDRWTWRDVLASIDDEDDGAGGKGRAAAPSAREPDPRRLAPQPSRAAPASLDRRPQPPGPIPAPEPARRAPLIPVAPQSPAPTAAPAAGGAPSQGAALIEAAGIRLGEVFNIPALERISQKARGGTQARRRAVREAEALRLANHLDADARARAEAAAFLRNDGARIAELLGRGRASMSADVTRAFLLIDAASS